jgi:hypothetical protein
MLGLEEPKGPKNEDYLHREPPVVVHIAPAVARPPSRLPEPGILNQAPSRAGPGIFLCLIPQNLGIPPKVDGNTGVLVEIDLKKLI